MTDGFVDLRSDTLSKPTAEMRRAMADAEVGDDCYGEDPTVNKLQEIAAEMLGTDAALYVPTGTMANQIALKVLTQPGGEVVCESDCHFIHFESGASAVLSQVQLKGLSGRLGVLDPADVRGSLRPDDPFQPRTVAVCIENTHNGAGGTVWPLEAVHEIAAIARESSVPLYCDGARMFNACVASGTKPREFADPCDLVSISLYKGLAAPMGSLVCGPRELVEQAWLYRRIFGGALRQAGVVAAAGILALEQMVDRLAEDHENARRLAEGIITVAPAGTVDLDRVHTNMVLFDALGAGLAPERVIEALRTEGVLAGLNLPGPVVRFVTHLDVSPGGVDRAISAFSGSLKALA